MPLMKKEKYLNCNNIKRVKIDSICAHLQKSLIQSRRLSGVVIKMGSKCLVCKKGLKVVWMVVGGGGGVSFRAWGNVDNTSYSRDYPRPQSQVRYCSELWKLKRTCEKAFRPDSMYYTRLIRIVLSDLSHGRLGEKGKISYFSRL